MSLNILIFYRSCKLNILFNNFNLNFYILNIFDKKVSFNYLLISFVMCLFFISLNKLFRRIINLLFGLCFYCAEKVFCYRVLTVSLYLASLSERKI